MCCQVCLVPLEQWRCSRCTLWARAGFESHARISAACRALRSDVQPFIKQSRFPSQGPQSGEIRYIYDLEPLSVQLHRNGRSLQFYETDLPLQQSMQETQLSADFMEAHHAQRIVLVLEAPKRLPVHSLWLVAGTKQYARRPSQTLANLVGLAGRTFCPTARKAPAK
jgi:hypothetical protein